jgi:hypothetical protein
MAYSNWNGIFLKYCEKPWLAEGIDGNLAVNVCNVGLYEWARRLGYDE